MLQNPPGIPLYTGTKAVVIREFKDGTVSLPYPEIFIDSKIGAKLEITPIWRKSEDGDDL
ncbi:MAG: hypothetical protein ACOX4S_06265 [Anaerovoracaceae bacterium]